MKVSTPELPPYYFCVWTLGVLIATGLVACDGCGPAPLAVLKKHEGTVDWQVASDSKSWSKASDGTSFHVGDALRTGHDSTAELTLAPEGAMQVKPDTVIRFLDTPPEAPRRLHVESGQVQVEATLAPIEIATGQGVARLSRGARVRVAAQDDSARVLVEVGSIEAVGQNKKAGVGQQMTLEVGAIITEEADIAGWDIATGKVAEEEPEELPPVVEREGADGDADQGDGFDQEDDFGDSSDSKGAIQFASDGTLPNLMLEGGRVVTVHDPKTPTKVGFVVPGCAQRARIEIRNRGSWSHGTGAGFVVAELPAGNYHYRGRCTEAATTYKVTGRIRIRNDAGTRRLPEKAAQTTIDADGRKYTVQYQNRLPIVRIRWPNAPPSEGYTLELRSGGDPPQQFKANADATVVLKSGTLDEGTYRYRMRATGGRSSLESTVRISFDNAARSAYLSAPQDGSFTRSDTVKIVGAALSGARVRSNDKDLQVSASGHFQGTSSVASTEDALVVQVTHRKSGTHYYLRYPQ